MSEIDPARDVEAPPPAPVKKRLHPLSPVLRGIKSLWVIIAAISWQGFARFGLAYGAVVVLAAGLLGLLWAWITWRYTGFRVTGRELRISEGVLIRRHRTIPLERLQSVEVVQPLLARFVGLAELRLEVVGAAKSEAPLAYLALAEAKRLRADLLEQSKHLDTAPTAETAVDTDEHSTIEPARPPARTPPVAVVPAKRLIQSQLLTPSVFILPIAIAATIALFVWQPDMSFFGLAGLVTATAGILLRPIRQAMTDYGFTLHDTPDGLRVRRGLTEQRTQIVPLNRVTVVSIVWPWLWRRAHWVQARVSNAGGGSDDLESRISGGPLLPVGSIAEAHAVTTLALSGVDMLSPTPLPAPRRARWCAPFAQPGLGAVLADKVFLIRSGRITPKLVAVPYDRIQSVRVSQGRLQRALQLATVHVDVAGGISQVSRAEHREVAEALEMAARLRERARHG